MRILYLCNSAHIGGGNRSLLTLWRALAAHGVDPVALIPGNGAMVAACYDAGVRCHVEPHHQPSVTSPLETARAQRRLYRLLCELQPALVHANDPATARTICLSSAAAALPMLCHVRFPPDPAAAPWYFRRLPAPDHFVFCSEALRAESGPQLARALPQVPQSVVHNAVDLTAFRPGAPRPSGAPRVGILANLQPVKGHLDFIEMAGLLTRRGLGAEYWIIGEDVQHTGTDARIRQRVRELGLEPRVRMLGHRDDVPALLTELDVLVCASHVEPFGRCLIEAMACELPVVATRVGGIPEVVVHEETGLLVAPRNPAGLAEATARLLEDRPLRQRMGEAGRQRATRLFSPDAHARRILALYAQLRARGASRRAA